MPAIKLSLYRVPVTRESIIRFSRADLVNIGTFSRVYDSCRVPDGYLSLKELDVVLPLDRNITQDTEFYQEFSYSYAVMEYAEKNLPFRKSYSCWWVDGYTQSANAQCNLTVHLVRDPWGDYINPNTKRFKGLFNKLPMFTAPAPQVILDNDTLYARRELSVDLPKIRSNATGGSDICWVEIITTRNPWSPSGVKGFTRIGTFVKVAADTLLPIEQVEIMQSSATPQTHLYTPTLWQITDNLVTMLHSLDSGFSESDIVDVSISERCPFKVKHDGDKIGIENNGGYTVDPLELWAPGLGNHIGAYWIQQDSDKEWSYTDTVTLTVTDIVRIAGQIQLKDGPGNIVSEIPTTLGSITFKCKTVGDISGLNTFLWSEDLQLFLKFPEGHLPYTGNAWLDYMAKNREYDRECMQINIEKANAEAANSVATGIASGVITGALTSNPVVGVASAALSVGSSLIGRGISISAEQRLQDAKEKSYKLVSNNTYNLGYGRHYAWLVANRSAHFDILLPANLDTMEELETVAKYKGYPAQGEHTVDMSPGYYRGYVIGVYNRVVSGEDETLNITAMPKHMMDIINQDLNEGIRIISDKEEI